MRISVRDYIKLFVLAQNKVNYVINCLAFYLHLYFLNKEKENWKIVTNISQYL